MTPTEATDRLDKAFETSSERAALRQILIVEPRTSAEIISFGIDNLDEEDQRALSVTDIAYIVEAVDTLKGYEYGGRDKLSDVAMNLSLCPLHMIDWAICFDDARATCYQIREIFPNVKLLQMFRFYTNRNGKEGQQYWFDNFRILPVEHK